MSVFYVFIKVPLFYFTVRYFVSVCKNALVQYRTRAQ